MPINHADRRAGRPSRPGYTAVVSDLPSNPAPRPVSIYIHVPFCTVKCAYCDFNSYANAEDQMPRWEAALLEELRRWAPATFGTDRSTTVFVGGGTPSLLEAKSIEPHHGHDRRVDYALASDAEITMEANPESVRLDRLRGYRAAGVNRLSIGVQSLNANELTFLDRLHDAGGAREAVMHTPGAPDSTMSAWISSMACRIRSLATWQTSLNARHRVGAGPHFLLRAHRRGGHTARVTSRVGKRSRDRGRISRRR